MKAVKAVVAVLLLAGAGVFLYMRVKPALQEAAPAKPAPPPKQVPMDKAVAAFTLTDLDGKATSSKDLLGADGKPVVIAFWSVT